MVDVRFIFLNLVAVSCLCAASQATVPIDVQPNGLACKSPLDFNTSAGSTPKVEATIGGRSVKWSVDPGKIQVFLNKDDDCGQNLTLTVDNFSKTYAIEPPNLADSALGMKELRGRVDALNGTVESFRDKTLLTLGFSLIVVLGVLGFIGWHVVLQLPRLILSRASPAAYPVSDHNSGLMQQNFQRIEQQFGSLQKLVQAQTASLAKQLSEMRAARSMTSAPVQAAARNPIVEQRREEEPMVAAAAASSSSRHEQTRPKSKPERFEDLYMRLVSEGNLSKLRERNPIPVSFENQAAMDRNPEADEPLVRNSQGWLMLFPYDDLAQDEYYVAPSLNFNGIWTETHRLAWRSVFNFDSSEAATLSQAAIATDIGGKWSIKMTGQFS
jgi:hypothetical protein